VASAEQSGSDARIGFDCRRRHQSELSQIEYGLVFLGIGEAHEVIEHFSDTERREQRILLVLHEVLDLDRRRFTLEQGEYRIRVEDDHSWSSRAASSLLD